MQKFTTHTGLVAPMDRENVDTDAIIPKQFLKSIRKTGFGPNLFDAWRYLDAGFPGQDPASRKPNPDFVLNQPRYKGASILLARKNFGCGSSREHAPWALDQYGFRVIIAPSYADIFFNNSFKNGLLPIVLPEAQVAQLFAQALAGEPIWLVRQWRLQRLFTAILLMSDASSKGSPCKNSPFTLAWSHPWTAKTSTPTRSFPSSF